MQQPGAATTSLSGLRVVELAGLAPSQALGMLLADHGADVLVVEPTPNTDRGQPAIPGDVNSLCSRGKRSACVNLKSRQGIEALKALIKAADVLIDPFRPGVLERLGMAPQTLLEEVNAGLVVVRLSGFGQTGPMAHVAGHDITYLAASGALSLFGPAGQPPAFPANLLGDFGGGAMMAAIGVMLALHAREKHRSTVGGVGGGQVVDAAISEGAAYLTAFAYELRRVGGWGAQRGRNLLDGGAPNYRCYACKGGGYMALGALEPKFWKCFVGLLREELKDEEDAVQALRALPSPYDPTRWAACAEELEAVFMRRSRDEWASRFAGSDACCHPVLSLDEAATDGHARARGSHVEGDSTLPAPRPLLSSTPGVRRRHMPDRRVAGAHTADALRASGVPERQVQALLHGGAAYQAPGSKL